MGEKTAGVGHFGIPALPAAGVQVTSATANNFTATYVALTAATPSALFITGVIVNTAIVSTTTVTPSYCAVQIAVGATGAESIVDQEYIGLPTTPASTALKFGNFTPIYPMIAVASGARVAAKTADSTGALPWLVSLSCIAQANVVDDGIIEAVNAALIGGTTSVALGGYVGLDWSKINAPTTAQGLTGTTISAAQAVASVTGAVGSVTGNVGGNVVGSVGSISGITFPTNFSALAITTAGAGGKVTTTDAYPANFTALAITTAGAVLTQDTYPANFTALSITTGGHISIVDTLTTYTGNTVQTGDSFARIGLAGVGLTNLGDTRIANLDAAVSTRSTYAGGAVASVTAPVTVGTNNDKTGYALTQSFPGNFATMAIDTNGNVSMTSNVKKNTAFNSFMFVMTDSTNHQPLAGLTVTATRSLDGAAFAACANAVTGISSGWYKIDLAATDTNANRVALLFTAAGADSTNIEINTQP